MERHYKHLNAEERGVILAEHRRGTSLRQVGRLLGRHHATIGLELTRGAAPGGYDPQVARLAQDMARPPCDTSQERHVVTQGMSQAIKLQYHTHSQASCPPLCFSSISQVGGIGR